MREETRVIVYAHIRKHPPHKCTISEIARVNYISRPTVTNYINVLLSEGLIKEIRIANSRAYVAHDKGE